MRAGGGERKEVARSATPKQNAELYAFLCENPNTRVPGTLDSRRESRLGLLGGPPLAASPNRCWLLAPACKMARRTDN